MLSKSPQNILHIIISSEVHSSEQVRGCDAARELELSHPVSSEVHYFVSWREMDMCHQKTSIEKRNRDQNYQRDG